MRMTLATKVAAALSSENRAITIRQFLTVVIEKK